MLGGSVSSKAQCRKEGNVGQQQLRPRSLAHRVILEQPKFLGFVKINPLICEPLSADFDGDHCIHLFYPQSISAKVEVYEPFSVEKQLLSSHSGNLHWQLATDSLLSLRVMLQTSLFRKADAQQLCMLLSSALPQPAFLKGNHVAPCWTAFQIIQTAFPACLDCSSNSLYDGEYLCRRLHC
ncbi:hypothetical protein V6N13_068400 [Hibiscus sabdariffa]